MIVHNFWKHFKKNLKLCSILEKKLMLVSFVLLHMHPWGWNLKCRNMSEQWWIQTSFKNWCLIDCTVITNMATIIFLSIQSNAGRVTGNKGRSLLPASFPSPPRNNSALCPPCLHMPRIFFPWCFQSTLHYMLFIPIHAIATFMTDHPINIRRWI
jgi:hypothetical protein